MNRLVFEFLASELLRSGALRFLLAELIWVCGIGFGLILSFRHVGVLVILVVPSQWAICFAIGFVPAALLAVIPAKAFSSTRARALLTLSFGVAFVLAGIAGYFYGEALKGI